MLYGFEVDLANLRVFSFPYLKVDPPNDHVFGGVCHVPHPTTKPSPASCSCLCHDLHDSRSFASPIY